MPKTFYKQGECYETRKCCVVGLVVLGVFGFAFAWQTVSSVGGGTAQTDGVVIGQTSCPQNKVTPVSGCKQERSKCEEQYVGILLVSCSGVIKPKCTIASFVPDPTSTEYGPYKAVGHQFHTCVRTKKKLPTCMLDMKYTQNGLLIMYCSENGPVSEEYDCPPGNWHSGIKSC